MIVLLEGKIVEIMGNAVILMVFGVGYKVSVSAYTLGRVAVQEKTHDHIHTHVRKDPFASHG